MFRFCMVLLALALAGCGTQAPFVTVEGGYTVLHVPTVDGTKVCTGPSCFAKIDFVIFYQDEHDKEHELDHVRGLRHGPWMRMSGKNCATVSDGGTTHFKTGGYICRANGGYYAG